MAVSRFEELQRGVEKEVPRRGDVVVPGIGVAGDGLLWGDLPSTRPR
jgi:hypothetical protein